MAPKTAFRINCGTEEHRRTHVSEEKRVGIAFAFFSLVCSSTESSILLQHGKTLPHNMAISRHLLKNSS